MTRHGVWIRDHASRLTHDGLRPKYPIPSGANIDPMKTREKDNIPQDVEIRDGRGQKRGQGPKAPDGRKYASAKIDKKDALASK